MKGIREVCKDKILIVDEAHGFHGNFNNNLFESSIKCGADLVVSSAHKSIGSIQGTSTIHLPIGSKISADSLKQVYFLLNTTSTSTLAMVDIESAVVTMIERGQELWDDKISLAKQLSERIAQIPNIKVYKPHNVFRQDPVKVIFKMNGLSGNQLYKLLLKDRIIIEKHTNIACVVSCLAGTSQIDIDNIVSKLDMISIMFGKEGSENELEFKESEHSLILKNRKIVADIRDIFGSETELVEGRKAIGRVSAEVIAPCPPG